MLQIVKNTYPKDGIGRHGIGTFCQWITEKGHLLLKKCTENGEILPPEYVGNVNINTILSKGQIYALNGNLLSGRTEPPRFGLVAKYVKNGWYLEIKKI